MSMELSLTVYGPQLANVLLGHDEELAYALNTFAEDGDPARLGADIADLIPDADAVITFLRALADANEAAK